MPFLPLREDSNENWQKNSASIIKWINYAGKLEKFGVRKINIGCKKNLTKVLYK